MFEAERNVEDVELAIQGGYPKMKVEKDTHLKFIRD